MNTPTPSAPETEPDSPARRARHEQLLGKIVSRNQYALVLLGRMPHQQSAIRGHFEEQCLTCIASTSISEALRDAQQVLAETATPVQVQPAAGD